MISHKHKCIFIHIPKCAGTTIKYWLFPNENVDWKKTDYNKLHGWCPERKFFMQHATSKQLLESNLITQEVWDSYFKFTFVRNPWDRAVSDYFWLMNDQKIKDSFAKYLLKSGKFVHVLNDKEELYYRGDHLTPQTDFFSTEGALKLDFVGKFENFDADMLAISKQLDLNYKTNLHINKSKKKKPHYSHFFSRQIKESFNEIYINDIEKLNYSFEDKQDSFSLKNLFKF